MLTSVELAGVLGCQVGKRDGSACWQADAPGLHWDAWFSPSPRPPIQPLWPFGCCWGEVSGGWSRAEAGAHSQDNMSPISIPLWRVLMLPWCYKTSAFVLVCHCTFLFPNFHFVSAFVCVNVFFFHLFDSQHLNAAEYFKWLAASCFCPCSL